MPFQALEIVTVDKIPVMECKKTEIPLASLKDAKALIEARPPHDSWGKLIEVSEKRDRSGLGYQLSPIVQASLVTLKGKQVPQFLKCSSVLVQVKKNKCSQ